MFIFDNAPSHRKKPEGPLDADKMNVSDGNGRWTAEGDEASSTGERIRDEGYEC